MPQMAPSMWLMFMILTMSMIFLYASFIYSMNWCVLKTKKGWLMWNQMGENYNKFI